MIINTIKLVNLNYSIKDLELTEDGTIYVKISAKIQKQVKKFDKNKFYVETMFELSMDNKEFPENPEEDDEDHSGLSLTYGVFLKSLEKEDEFNKEEQEMILMCVEPYFTQKVSSLFSESEMRVPNVPINFWREQLGEL